MSDVSDHESSFEIIDSEDSSEECSLKMETLKIVDSSSEVKASEDAYDSHPESSFEVRESESPDSEAWRQQVTSVERNLHIGHIIDALTHGIDPKDGILKANLISHAIDSETEIFEISESREEYFEQIREEVLDIYKERNIPIPQGPRDVDKDLRDSVVQQIMAFSVPEAEAKALELDCFENANDRKGYCDMYFHRIYMERSKLWKRARKVGDVVCCQKAQELQDAEASQRILEEMAGCWKITSLKNVGDFQDLDGNSDFSSLMGTIMKITTTTNNIITLTQHSKSGYYYYGFVFLITPKDASSTDYIENNQWISVLGDRRNKHWIQDGKLFCELNDGEKSLTMGLERTEDITKAYGFDDIVFTIFAVIFTILLATVLY